ncbi:MAG: hypothetical protein RR846_01270 [Oscillospiraceae bacterium]
MLYVADYLQLENLQKKELSRGKYHYTANDIEIFFGGIAYNNYFEIDRAEAAEIYKAERFLDAQQFPYDSTIESPFIEYTIGVSSANNTIDWYVVDITGELKDELNKGKEWLVDSKFLTENLEERKLNLLNLLNPSEYNKAAITLISKTESKIPNNGDDTAVSDGYLYGITEDGQHIYFKDYGSEFVFYGKYSLYNDMYNLGGYDVGDKIIINFNGEIPKSGDISNMNLISIIPEYSLMGGKAVDPKLGEEKLLSIYDNLYKYLYEYHDITYKFMSIEECILDTLKELNLDAEKFYKQTLKNGGYYYTDGNTSILGIANMANVYFNEAEQPPSVFISFRILTFDGIPTVDNAPIKNELFFNTKQVE